MAHVPSFENPDEIQESPNVETTEEIVINDKTFKYSENDQEKLQELQELKKIAEREAGQKQFVKQGICTFLLLCVILMNYL